MPNELLLIEQKITFGKLELLLYKCMCLSVADLYKWNSILSKILIYYYQFFSLHTINELIEKWLKKL